MATDSEPQTADPVRSVPGRSLLAAGLTFSLAVALCGVPAGETVALDTRHLDIGEFERVHFSGAGTVRLIQGTPPRLAVRGQEEAIDAVEVEIREGALYIETSGMSRSLVLELRVPRLKAFFSEGEGRITGDDLSFEELHLEGSGAGSFHMHRLEARALSVRSRGATRFDLTGQVGRQTVELSGTGAYQAGELISTSTRVNVAGASDVRLWAEETLDVKVAGSADIRYAGSPRVEQRISGEASVLRIPQIAI